MSSAGVRDRGEPSVAAVAIGTAIVSGLLGYFIGQAQSIGVFSPSQATRAGESAGSDNDDDDNDLDDDDDDDEPTETGDLQRFVGNSEECKLVLVVRNDLGMGKGKIAAQCGHATLACFTALQRADPAHPLLRRWQRLGQAKVALKLDGGEEELVLLQARAASLGLCARIIHDAGRTQIASGSATVLGIGPAPKSVVDQVTGHLKLL